MSAAEEILLGLIQAGALRVAEDGRIWRMATRSRTGRERLIEPRLAEHRRTDGYWRTRAGVVGREVTAASHRLVWTTTNGPIPAGLEINHRDGDRGNNRIKNLELVTPIGNLIHSYRELGRPRLLGERNPRGRLTREQVRQIHRLAPSPGMTHRVLGRQFGVSHRAIGKILSGQTWRDEFPEVDQ